MTTKTQTCCECGKKRERCRPSVRHVGGVVDHVCPQCWRRLDYDEFMYEHLQGAR